ncbi:MAG: uroporphyrinogen-III synthase [Desulfobacterales bacterium]|nr:uroporphyrinogen-III synthase [Desulfobacterales bacterium]
MPPASWELLDRALDSLESYHWIIFTSANGVKHLLPAASRGGKGYPRSQGDPDLHHRPGHGRCRRGAWGSGWTSSPASTSPRGSSGPLPGR